VDDEPNIRRLIEHHLVRRGHRVETAVNGTEALEKVRTARPELLVLDVNMPGPDGFEVLAQLKEDPATVEIPVIMLTALSTDDHIRRGWGIGADVYLSKPFNPHELGLLVDRWAAVLGTPDNPPPLRRWLK
jgi:two-component system alkaline phosphatase synthesis response regulator PhoP/two-component system response regulator VicR